MSVAVLDGVTKRFGRVIALDALSLALEPGSTVAILGPNGAGKSTLASVLLGLRRPDAGSVTVVGRDPRDFRARAAVGAALQEMAFPQPLRVGEIVEFVRRHFPGAAAPDRLLEALGLVEHARRPTGALSTGQRRRLAVALAFIGRPALVVLDEPTAALDVEGRRAVWAAVGAARADGACILVATHQLDEAEAVASRVVVIDRGRVVADGGVDEIKARAGLTRIRFRGDRPPPLPLATVVDGVVSVDAADAGAAVAELVARGIPLPALEVRALTLEEALEVLGGGGR